VVRQVLSLGKPTVIVLLNGGAVAIDGLKDKPAAILEAFYPSVYGAQVRSGRNDPLVSTVPPKDLLKKENSLTCGGIAVTSSRGKWRVIERHVCQALVDVLFGSVSPSGKLPYTMYASAFVNQSDFLNMSMQTGPGKPARVMGDL
jgi:xylan 1,4-beta-xylosidase